MSTYLRELENEFRRVGDPAIALQQSAYMRDKFPFFGIKSGLRREVQKPFLQKEFLPPLQDARIMVKDLWNKPEREFHYFGQEFLQRYKKKLENDDISLITYMMTHHSWWDTVDFITTQLVGHLFQTYPELKESTIPSWMASGNIWLQRSCLLFQIKYKEETDEELLAELIIPLLGSNEFFINKAIGWALRQYSRSNPAWVRRFVETHPLHSLSKKEALRLLA
ncbi:MAG: DNA alkylation repair protein [Bacteroidota bacterium]